MSQPTVTLFFDKRGQEKGFGVVKLCITYERKQPLRSTGLKMTKADFDKLQRAIDDNGLSQKIKNEYLIQSYNFLYGEKSDLLRAKKLINELGDKFSIEQFLYYYDEKISPQQDKKSSLVDDAIQVLMMRYEELTNEERIGTANLHKDTANSLLRFLDSLSKKARILLSLPPTEKDTQLPFLAINEQLLQQYESYMLKCGKVHAKKEGFRAPISETTIGIYLRTLKAVYNIAIKHKVASLDNYPFGSNGYTIPRGEGTKRALKKQDIEKIMNYKCEEGSTEEVSKFIWIFSYLSNGMNVGDICRLKFENINFEEKKIEFVRTKTIRTTKGQKRRITTMLFPILETIIEKIGNKDRVSDNFVFPFLNGKSGEKEIKKAIASTIQRTNIYMNQIGEKLGITEKLDTYVARHSFATILARSNASIVFISQSLGHKNIETTQSYLAGFEEEQVKEYLKALI